MKTGLYFLLLSVFFLCPLLAEEKKVSAEKQAVYEMFEAQGMREQMDHIRTVMLANQLKAAPELTGYMYELSRFYIQCAGFDVLKEELAEIYLKHFTVDEIRQITVFYRSPVGKKMRSVSSSVLLEANELARRRLEAGVPRFLEELKKKGEKK
jgi:hypothetical protein